MMVIKEELLGPRECQKGVTLTASGKFFHMTTRAGTQKRQQEFEKRLFERHKLLKVR